MIRKTVNHWQFYLIFLFLVGLLSLPFTLKAVRAQSDCTDPATGLQCTPTLPLGCFDAAGAACTPTPPQPADKPRATATPKPTLTPTPPPTFTPSPTTTATATPTVDYLPIGSPFPTLVPSSTPFPTPTRRPSFDGAINTIKVKLFPTPPTVIRWVLSEGNLMKITNAEITQAIQCLDNSTCPDNSVPLVTGKPTLVRVYARIANPNIGAIYNVGGAICPGDTGENGCANPIRPLKKINVYNIDSSSYKFYSNQRGDLGLTLNFLLPVDWISSAGQKQFTVYINYNMEDRPYESVYKDNHFLITAEMRQSKPLGLDFIIVQDHGEIANLNSIFAISDYIKSSYPTSIFNIHATGYLVNKNYAWNVANDKVICGVQGFGDLLSDLSVMRGKYKEMYYGLIPDAGFAKAEGNTYGCGAFPTYSLAYVGGGLTSPLAQKNQSTSLTFIQKLAAHEIGHMTGLRHAPGCTAGGPDTTYPNTSGMLDEVGINVAKMRLYQPSSTFDFMGYCGRFEEDSWISVHNTYKLLDLLPKGVYVPPQLASLDFIKTPASPDKVVLVTGSISPQEVALKSGFFRMDSLSAPDLTPNYGDYTITLYDENSIMTYSQNFAPMQGEEYGQQGETMPGGTFTLVSPWQDGVQTISFSYLGSEIARYTVSANAPEVSFILPAGGETWGTSGVHTVTWQASDAENHVLTYILQFSADNGNTWKTVGANLDETSMQFDSSLLPGSNSALFRVLASDGWNTTETISQPVHIASKAPYIDIESPVDGTQVVEGSAVLLYAQALDIQDGYSEPAAFSWTSDRDDALGSGDQVLVQNLSLGRHTLMVDVVNKAGLHTQKSVSIDVVPAEPVYVESMPGRSSLKAIFMTGLLLFGTAIFAALVILVRKKRRNENNNS